MIRVIGQRDSHRPSRWKARARRGQTLVEFALTLPILLLLLFGIIEFGRIFQAWVTLQNAARTAVRYAITGQYDQNAFHIDDAWTPENSYNLDGIPCYFTPDAAQPDFQQHWGHPCNPAIDDDYWLRRDMLRLINIYEQA